MFYLVAMQLLRYPGSNEPTFKSLWHFGLWIWLQCKSMGFL